MECHQPLFPVHGEIRPLGLFLPLAVLSQDLSFYRFFSKFNGCKLVFLYISFSQERLLPGKSQQVQRLVGGTAAIRAAADDDGGHIGLLTHCLDCCAVVHPVGIPVQKIELSVEGKALGACVRHTVRKLRPLRPGEFIELGPRMDQPLSIQKVDAVDPSAVGCGGSGGIAHPLAHLAYLVPDHVGRRRGAALVHVGGAVQKVNPPEILNRRGILGLRRRD